MTHHHSVKEAPRSKAARRRKPAVAYESPVGVHNVGIAVNHTRIRAHTCGNARKHIGTVETVAGIQENNKVAGSHGESLVHGIINALVRLAHRIDLMTCLACVAFLIMKKLSHRTVVRISVNHQMFHVRIVLFFHTVKSALYYIGGVIGYGCHREFYFFSHFYFLTSCYINRNNAAPRRFRRKWNSPCFSLFRPENRRSPEQDTTLCPP